MRELSITRSSIATVWERSGDARVTRVRLEIGQLSAIALDAVRLCFDVARRLVRLASPADGTLARARLNSLGVELR